MSLSISTRSIFAFTHSLPAPHALPWVDSGHESNTPYDPVYTYDKEFFFQMHGRTYLCYVRDNFNMPEIHNVEGYVEFYFGDPAGHGMWCGSDQGGYWGFGLSGGAYPEITPDLPWVDTTHDMIYVDPSATFNGGYGTINPGYVGQNSVIFPANLFPSPSSQFKLPDTGQTACYDSIGNVITCPAPGQPLAQDGSYSINPMSFTDNDDGTVTDNNTRLVWQKETDGQIYHWFEANGIYDALYNPNSKNVCGNLLLGGQGGWRVPSNKELLSLVNYNNIFPAIDPIFTNTRPYDHWTSTTLQSDPTIAITVHFDWGGNGAYYKHSPVCHVRCVKSENITPQSFTDNGDGTVTDNATGLVWQQDTPSYMPWESALNYCEGLNLADHMDWRLPNNKELISIADETKYNPAIDTVFFPNTYSSHYWASTTIQVTFESAFAVLFENGLNFHAGKGINLPVRCVRGGQAQPPTPPSCTYTYSDWGACQSDGTQTRSVLMTTPEGCTGTPVLSQSCNYIPPAKLTVAPDPVTGGIITGPGIKCGTDNQGSYGSCQNSYTVGSSITLTATSMPGCTFSQWDGGWPFNPMTFNINSDVQVKAIFTCVSTYSVSGTITNLTGGPLSGVNVTLSNTNVSYSTQTDSNGHYSFLYLVNGSYTITPTMAGYSFNPENRNVIVRRRDIINRNFKGERIPLIISVPFLPQVPPGIWARSNNCGQTSVLMVISYLNKAQPTPQGIIGIDDWLFQKYSDPVNNYNGSVTNTTKLEAVAKEYAGFINSFKVNGWSLDNIKSQIDLGNPVIAAVTARYLSNRGYGHMGGHFVVVTGYNDTNIICNDPGTRSGQNKYYSNTDFRRAFLSQGGSAVVLLP